MLNYLKKKIWLKKIIKTMNLSPLKEWQTKFIFENDPIDAYITIRERKGYRGIGKTTTVYIKALIDTLCDRSFDRTYKYFLLDPDFQVNRESFMHDYSEGFHDFASKFVDAYSEDTYETKLKPAYDILSKIKLENLFENYKQAYIKKIGFMTDNEINDSIRVSHNMLKSELTGKWRYLLECRINYDNY